ncbi:protein FAR1-RELATED SEQUENCE 5-like [Setaria italica]|uniref:protein FAR1-RELATED SEQUENCE 5-like n=1 Tax=Setaria italica TaxID=4555 RepID=UPI000646A7A5|nr:protein FAR1-RELATED SEQUENCE 5-like [Setaria italica]
MAVGSQEKDNVLDSSPMVSSVPALAHNGMQPTQIAQNYSDDNIRVCCMIPEEIADEAPDKMADEVVQPMIVPEVGMAFESEDKAYEMYNTYASKIGFSIRKSHTKRRGDGTLCQKYLVCSNEGHREIESSRHTTRTGCNARVQFSVSKEGIWTVQKVILDHNHYLASPNKRGKLRSQRSVQEADRKLIGQMRESGMKPAQVFEFMKEFYGGTDKVPFSRMDCNNEIGRERKKYLESNDAETLLEYLKRKQMEDPTFFYAMQIDKKDGRIANFFWADGQSIMDYACFGDAVSFDTTFQTNKFEMPFAPFLGTNHHKQTIIFGAALLFDETIPSFVWLFETFLTAMSGKHPSTIFTDQDAAMAGAIAYVFPNTSHRLCLWHIYLNAAKHLGHVIQKHPDKFLPDFKRCVYEDRSEFYFKKKWDELLRDYNLEDNKWMANLYDLRAKWAAVYRDSFTADMNSTQRSEGMNNVFKKRFRRKLGLSELLEECEKVSNSLHNNELDEDFNSRRKSPVTHIPLLKTAAESYTGRMYKEFEEEFNKQFSFSCILCKHAFKVFNVNDVFILPSQYIQHRWTKYAKRGFYIQKQGSEEESLKTHTARISRKATSIALKCSKSKELLDLLEEAMDKLDLDADNYLSKMEEQSNEAPLVSANFATDTFKGTISFRVPEVVKGAKSKRGTIFLEKNTGKKKKTAKKKGEESNNVAENSYEGASPDKFIDLNDGSVDANSTIPHFNMHGNSSVMSVPYIRGGYTSLLLGVDQTATMQLPARKLDFDGPTNKENM